MHIIVDQIITIRENSGEDALIKGAGSEVPDLVGMRKQTLAYKFSPSRRNPYQVNLQKIISIS